jgi:hypothetical protein
MHINPPNTADASASTKLGPQHPTAAAKLIFFDVEPAQKFWEAYNGSGIPVGDHVRRVVRHRVETQAAAEYPPYVTRHLVLSGPDHIVNESFVLNQFQRVCEFQIDQVNTQRLSHTKSLMSLLFATYRAQAEAVARMIERNKPIFPDTKLSYGADRCSKTSHIQ